MPFSQIKHIIQQFKLAVELDDKVHNSQ